MANSGTMQVFAGAPETYDTGGLVMVFSSLIFVCIFLPALLALYYLVPARHRNWVGLAGSLFFYAWGAPRFVFVLPVTGLLDLVLSRMLVPGLPGRRRKVALTVGIGSNVVLLLYFKYANFFVDQLNAVLGAASLGGVEWPGVVLPIGISFFTFQKLSYLVDVYRGVTSPARSYRDYLLYVMLFPQLIAGPIVRYHDIAKQLLQRRYDCETFLRGMWRFCLGLSKKVLLANQVGFVADRAFAGGAEAIPAGAAWLGVTCYAFQIYFDFSGYSDMAIGLGNMLGFRFLENFRAPYISRSVTEFWRRWHISLSNWMREYLYIPLGGNRVAPWRRAFNLWVVFLVSGFWHGAAWPFVAWGAYHGACLSVEKLTHRWSERLPVWISVPVTFVVLLIGWVLFRAGTLAEAWRYLLCMAGAGGGGGGTAMPMIQEWMTPQRWAALALSAAASFGPIVFPAMEILDWDIQDDAPRALSKTLVRTLACTLLLVLSLMALITGDFNPFIYFRF